MNTELLYKQEIPGFSMVFQSIRRLAAFHKIEMEDAASIAVEGALAHPNNVQAAIKMARRTLNNQRRQRLPGRPIDDRTDGEQVDGVEVLADLRTLPGGKTLKHLNEEGEWVDNEITEDDKGYDPDRGDEDYHLPKLSPSNLCGAIIFLADHGHDVRQIAGKTGVTAHRIRQILRDRAAITKEVERAKAQPELPGMECEPGDIPSRKPVRHKPRVPRAVLPASDQTPHPQPSLF